MMSENLNLVQYLRKIQVEWELGPEELAKISHVSVAMLQKYFSLPLPEMNELPSLPVGLESAMPLVSVYKNLVTMFPDSEKQNEWLVVPNELFEGNKPIEVMAMSPDHLSWVSYTLESQVSEKRLQ
jgi:hypothetical protein